MQEEITIIAKNINEQRKEKMNSISMMPIGDIIPYAKNPRKNKDAVDKVAASLREFGFKQPIVVDKDNVIIVGHTRLLAAKKLKMKEVPVLVADDLSEEKVRAYRLADNKTASFSEWDDDLLSEELDSILDIDMEQFGFDLDFEDEDEEEEPGEPEDDPFADIETGNRYGVPYQGNKSRIADILISVLPSGRRLVDLFGGGGAITHCALLSDKWQYFLYNDINPMITGLFMDAVHGKYHDERRVITRADFDALKDTDAYVAYIWSFGNSPAKGYLWGKDIEEIKCTACHALLDENLQDRRSAYVKFIKLLENNKDTTLNRLQSIEHLQGLLQLESLQRLESSNISYTDYEYQEGDIVYCDIPYEQSGAKKCDDYGVAFDSQAFYEWVKAQPYQVFFSSYEISDNSFYKLKIKEVQSLIGASTNGQKATEYLYSNMPIQGDDSANLPF